MKAILLSLCVWMTCFSSIALELIPLSSQPYTGDLDALVKKRVVRVLVSADLGFYYIENGQPKGVGAELLYHFENSLQKKYPQLKVQVIPVPRDDLLPSLVNGYGDLIVANLTVTPQREEAIQFSDPIVKEISEFIVTGPDYPSLNSVYDLSAKEVWVRGSSSYFESLQQINQQLQQKGKPPIIIKYLEETLQDYELVEMLKLDYIKATVLDSHKALFWKKTFADLNIHQNIPIRTDGEIAWAMRKHSPELLKVVNNFIKTAKAGTLLGNIIYQRYMDSTAWFSRVLAPSYIEQLEKLSALFKKYGDMYNFDFLLLAALAFQESKLNQSVVSAKGAVGIMQILPSTAKDPNVNIGNITNVENNIHAGTKYLRFLEDRYFNDPEISDNDRIYLSLAAYNAGPGNISRMRALAKQQGYDPNRWFNNVEVVTRRYLGSEPITYVANINRYYVIYKQLASLQQIRREQHANNNNDLPSTLMDLYRNTTIE